MNKTRKKQILSLITSMTLLSGIILPCSSTALAAERQNPVSYGDQAPDGNPAAPESGSYLENTSVLSSTAIAQGKTVKVWLSSKNSTGTAYYDVYYKKANKTDWFKAAENISKEFVKIKPSVATDYIIRVDAKDSSGNISTSELPLHVASPLNNTSYLSSENIYLGDSIKVFCRSEGGVGQTEYAVYYKRSSKTDWIKGKDYSTSDTVFIRPKVAAAYDIRIRARDESGEVKAVTLTLQVKNTSDLQNRTELSAKSIAKGDSVTISNAAAGGKNNIQFASYYKQENSDVWTRISDYSKTKLVSFKPSKTGKYIVRTKVKDSEGRVVNKDIPLTVTKKSAEPTFSAGETNDTINSLIICNKEEYEAMQQEADPSYKLPVIPSKVDNSTNEYFPPIVKQVGSTCCIYSNTYYQYTYEYNRAHNIVTNEKNCFSPAYTYNLATDARARGMSTEHGYTHLKYGAVTADLVPFVKKESDVTPNYYKDLPLDEEVYRFAADHRIRYSYEFSRIGDQETLITSPDDEDLAPVKAALADGHVLSVYCYSRNWRYKELESSEDDPTVNIGLEGQNCIYYSFGEQGDHKVTIVGYDDNVWTDINSNKKIDQGEMGAFKIANSWGKDWGDGNKGYIWMAYDALNLISCHKDFKYESGDKPGVETPEGIKLWRMHGMYHISGIQLMPADYKASVFMHYVANTKDRVNSYAYLIGEYNGETVTECMDPFNHTVGEFTAVAYNLSNPEGYAHFVYDISTAMRKLGADDYTKVKWTVKFEYKGSSNSSMKISDVYLCDEKNYRIYRTSGSFPLNLNSGSKTLTLSDTYTRYAKVNYRGYSDKVELRYYAQSDDEPTCLLMSPVSTVEGYTHTAIVELKEQAYYNVFFHDTKSLYDENEKQDYRIYPGENNFETLEAIKPLKIKLQNVYDDDCYLIGENPYIWVSAEGGAGSYRFRYTVRDMKTGAVLFDGDYGYATKKDAEVTSTGYAGKTNAFSFEKPGDYQITVYARDITGNTVHKSYSTEVLDYVP